MAKILAVTAHPDDETASFGGTLIHYSGLGVECRLICLTAGEAARNRGGAPNNAALQALRRRELAESCALLGVDRHEVWDLADAHLPQTDFYAAVSRLVMEIRDYRPELVLTLGPEGSATAHLDHGMAAIIATAAFHWAANPKFLPDHGQFQAARLYYATMAFQPPQFPPVWLPGTDVTMRVEAHLERKLAAFQAHRTQAPLFDRVAAFMRLIGGEERFHLAAGAPGLGAAAADLFEGLPHLR